MNTYLTDAERQYRPAHIRGIYRFWIDFSIRWGSRPLTFRRWFDSLETRNAYVLNLPIAATVTDHGEEPRP